MGMPFQASGRAMGMWQERQAMVAKIAHEKMQKGLDEGNAFLQAGYLMHISPNCPNCGANRSMGTVCPYCGT